MSTIGRPELLIHSDLQLVVDGLHTRLVADGRRLSVQTEDAGLLLARAAEAAPMLPGPGTSVRGLVGRVADLLDDAGITARVTSRGWTVVELGHGCHSRVGRVLLGTDRIALGPVAVLAPTLARYVRASTSVRSRVSYTSAGVVIAALLAGAGVRRGRKEFLR